MNKIICLPILSVRVLFYLMLNNKNKTSIVYYELLPKYLRGFIKLFRISEIQFLTFFNKCLPLKIQKIYHGDKIKNYNIIRQNISIKIVDICEKFISKSKKDLWFNSLESLVHNSVVIPTFIKFLSYKQLQIQLVSVKICLENSTNKYSNIILYNNYYWPDELLQIINNDEYFSGVKFKNLPKIFEITNKVINILKIFKVQLKHILTKGIEFNKVSKKSYEIATEIFDLKMLGRTNNDSDFFIDNKNLKYSNSIFYITKKHRNILKKNGYSSSKINNFSKSKGINIIELYKLSIPFVFIKKIIKWNFIILTNIFKKNTSSVFNLFPYILDEYLDYSTLFQYYNIRNHIHFINPNGRAPLMLNSAIITGICREYNTKSCGIQNRVIHSREYEFSFDSYDLYFSWGKLWIDLLGSALQFVDKIIIIGSLNLSKQNFSDILRLRNNNDVIDSKSFKPKVLIFPADIELNPSVFSAGVYSISYNISFLKACLVLAKQYPQINFQFKLKDPSQIDIYNNWKEFKELQLSDYPNFNILKRPRMKFMDLLSESELVISIGFTTPGIDAILLGKKSIYYNKLDGAGMLFKKIPDFVARDTSELVLFFKKLINETKYSPINVNLLDPFLDGNAIERIVNNLAKN